MTNVNIDKVQTYFDWEFRKHPSFLLNQTDSSNFFIPSEKYARSLLGNYDTGLRILEIGSGDCIDSIALSGSQNEVWAIEISSRRLKLARKNIQSAQKYEQILPVFMDAHYLGFPDNYFDLILGNSVLLFLDKYRFIAECFRVLKPGGRALFPHESMAKHPLLLLRRTLPKVNQREDIAQRITIEDIHRLGSQFDKTEHRQYYLISTLFAALPIRFGQIKIVSVIINIAYSLDNIILRLIPIFKDFCWVSVIMFHKDTFDNHPVID